MKITNMLSVAMICLFTFGSFASFAGEKKGFEMDKNNKTTLESAAESAATTTTTTIVVNDLNYNWTIEDCRTSGSNCSKTIIKSTSTAIMSGGNLTGVELNVNATLTVEENEPIPFSPLGAFQPRYLSLGAITFGEGELQSHPDGVTLVFDTYYMVSPTLIMCSGPSEVE